MSIFIFGHVNNENNEKNNSYNWTGNWYFAKNKTINTIFSYKKNNNNNNNNEISKELIDYVSFINENNNKKVSKRGRKSKSSRGRPRLNSTSSQVVVSIKNEEEGDITATEVKTERIDENEEQTTTTQVKSDPMETKLMEENESVDDTLEEGDDDTTEQGSENKLNQSRDEMDVEPVDMKATDVSSENVESQTNSDLPKFIKIPPRHPLFGVWEGHFSLPSKNSDGTVYEELVEESFFFYAFEGDSEEDIVEPGLRQLPYPPRWTAAYIRELHIAHRRDNGMEEGQDSRHTQLVPSEECVASSPRVGKPPNTPKNLKKEVSFDTQLEQDNSNRDEASSVTEEVTSTESKKTTSQSEVKVNLQENSEVESKKHCDGNVKAIGSIEDTKKNSNSVNTGPVSHSTTETETVIESTPSTDISTSCTSQAKSAPRFTQQQVSSKYIVYAPG